MVNGATKATFRPKLAFSSASHSPKRLFLTEGKCLVERSTFNLQNLAAFVSTQWHDMFWIDSTTLFQFIIQWLYQKCLWVTDKTSYGLTWHIKLLFERCKSNLFLKLLFFALECLIQRNDYWDTQCVLFEFMAISMSSISSSLLQNSK